MRTLLALPALLLAANTWASCPKALPENAPVIPDGTTATYDQVYDAQEAVREYVTEIETYLECREGLGLHLMLHNRAVHLAQTAAKDFNASLSTFRQRKNMLANN
ncbi:hypothetical protein [Kineobactrum sediminis]|nr:hypothetical protein [Kineobactrum sediminis]